MTFSDWTNHAVCVANGADITCGPGTQVQVQTCTDGEIEKCTEYQITRTVTCAAAGSELPACPGIF